MGNQRQLKIGVLASGRGTNLQAIINASEKRKIDAEVVIVISDKPEAQALQRAQKHQIETAVHLRKDFTSREAFEAAIVGDVRRRKVDLICLAGFMRIIGPTLLRAFPRRILNIHPSLLPSFPGLDAQRQAFDHGVKISGCTVHFVDDQLDHGPIILQQSVAVKETDTVESLTQRILNAEHKIYPQAIQLFSKKRMRFNGRRIHHR